MTKNEKIVRAAFQFVHAMTAKTGSRGDNGSIQSEAWKRILEVICFNQSSKNKKKRIERKNNRVDKYGRYNSKMFFDGLEFSIRKAIRDGFSNKAA